MLYRVIGSAGSGKTEYLLARLGKALAAGNRCVLIVPEQQTLFYESLLCERFGDGCNLLCETLNFQRLPNRIAREYGNLAVNNIDKGGACALLSLTAESLKDRLKEYSVVASDPDFASSLLSLYSRMQMALITPKQLSDASNDPVIAENSALAQRLAELSLILDEYSKNFGEGLFDPRDSLTVLADELPKKPFFKGAYVFIDGYYNFTVQEHAVIRRIIDQSKDTYITFTTDRSRRFFAENEKSASAVLRGITSQCEDIYLDGWRRSDKKSLAFLESHLWETAQESFAGDDGGVKLISAANRFDECESAAAEILSFVRAGNRWRDVCVLAGKYDSYSGIVDSVFKRAGIPSYTSAVKGLSSHPLAAFLLASLAVVNDNFSLRSVKRYIKSGFTDLTVSESDILLSYAESWNICGKSWYGDNAWTMDPEGYREGDLTKRGEAILNIANSARDKLVPALAALREDTAKKEFTVSAGVKALYDHLISCRADEKLRARAEMMLNAGDREGSDREIQVWKLIINILDQLHTVCGIRTVNSKRLYSLIKLMLDNYSLGAIPSSVDSVMFGDASMVRAGGHKMVIVLGVCDGEFPASGSSGVFFDKDDAGLLESVGIELADTIDKSLNTGRFLVYSAFTAPSERLVVSYPRSEIGGEALRRSTAYLSLEAMFKDIKPVESAPDSLIYSRESVAAAYPFFEKCELRDRIGVSLRSVNEPFFDLPPEVCDKDSKIDFQGDVLTLSPSRFERYALCPFSFFGSYVLGLKEKKKNDWATPEIGNFIHKILEQFMRSCVDAGGFVLPTEAERKDRVRELARRYFLDVIGAENLQNKRFMHTYEAMIKTLDSVAADICAEFAESKFIPAGFEFKIGLQDADMPAVRYDSDGKRIFIRGSIDRVDTYVQNGVTYVRVIDYKTYRKPFKADLVEYGLDTQMLHYLFAYCQNKNAVPAGVLYYTVALPYINITGNESDSDLRSAAEKALKREGILLDDPEIVFAMSESCDFVPVSRRKDGGISDRGHHLRSTEQFNELCKLLDAAVKRVSKDVFDGNMDISPNDADGNAEPCKYCKLADFCRAYDKRKEDDDEADQSAD